MAVRATSSETIDRFKDQPLIFKTGEGYSYSGVGYFLLGQVIEKVAGMSYEAFLREAILDPAGMKNTGPDRYDVLLPDRAAGYTPTEQGLQNAAPIFMPVLTGGGNLYSTVGDLWRFDRALTSGEFISEESYKQMYTTVRQGYGYGWRVANWSGYRGIMHGGGVSGFNAFLLRFPEQQVCVVVLSNVNPTPMRDISNRLASIVLDEPTLANPNG
jgi:CubicO group peptidase (beta-lactamase class C family)